MSAAKSEEEAPQPRRLYVLVKPKSHRTAVSSLLEKFPSTVISTITGIDLGSDIELNYHLWCGKTEVTVRTRVPKEKPEIETITDFIPGAAVYKRQVFDLLGVRSLGHSNLKRLLLPEMHVVAFALGLSGYIIFNGNQR